MAYDAKKVPTEDTTTVPCPVCKHTSEHDSLFGCGEVTSGEMCGCTITATISDSTITISSPASANPPKAPYAGTSGWSGSATSRERAQREDSNGTTSHRQTQTLEALRRAGADGLVWKELGARFSWHHGQASGVLSVLHKEGAICRLTERRRGCQVYVLPEYVHGRETSAHGTRGATKKLTPQEEAAYSRLRNGGATPTDVAVLLDIVERIAGPVPSPATPVRQSVA